MIEKQIKIGILDALEAGYVSIFSDSKEYEIFLSGERDYRFDELDMDSVGTMEFCISLEMNNVFVITPEELINIESLNQLVQIIIDSKS